MPQQDNNTLQNLLSSPDQLGAILADQDDTDHTSLLTYEERYVDMQPLGSGAIKQVYQCYDNALKRHLAYAEVRPELSDEYDQALLTEAWLTTTLDHPNIITLHDIGTNDAQRAFFTMDLKTGDDFADYIAKNPSSEDLIEQFLKICYALSYAHSKGVLHLDLKPQNIQCGEHGEVQVCDWGLGKLNLCGNLEGIKYPPHLEDLMEETLYGTIKGSLGFMAPEQVRPDWIKDVHSDLYGLGSLLYYAITGGSPPYEGDKDDIIEQTRQGNYTPLSTRNHASQYGKSLCNIVEKCLSLSPADRYQSVSELIRDLKLYRAGHPTSADPPSLGLRLSKFVNRHRITVATLLCVLSIIATISLFYRKSIREQQTLIDLAQNENAILSTELPKQVIANIKNNPNYKYLPQNAVTDLNIIMTSESLNATSNGESLNNNLYSLSKYQYLNCIRLDFRSALSTYPEEVPSNKMVNALHNLSHELQEYSYNSSRRPSLSQLREILERFPPYTSELKLEQRIFYYYQVIKYDHECRKNLDGYEKVICTALKSLYATEGLNLQISYHPEEKHLTIECPRILPTKLPGGYGILTYLDIEHLTLLTLKQTDLFTLAGLPNQTLDLSSCSAPYLSRPVNTPLTSKIILPSYYNEQQARRLKRVLKIRPKK